ncbi:response regulator [Isoptericola sp. NPDC060282]|uniref:response regulator n=1 Tax=Isoptericola sp. NPDC060282 TaxID=3347093 RepID=UPI003651F318
MRVTIAEDSALLREGLRALLTDEGITVDAAVGDAAELLALLGARTPPDVVVVDVRMPPTHTDEGIRAALEIRRRWPGVAVLVLSQYVESGSARELVTGGGAGVGYLLKDRVMRVAELLDALHRVARGDFVVDPEVVLQLFADSRRADPGGGARPPPPGGGGRQGGGAPHPRLADPRPPEARAGGASSPPPRWCSTCSPTRGGRPRSRG